MHDNVIIIFFCIDYNLIENGMRKEKTVLITDIRQSCDSSICFALILFRSSFKDVPTSSICIVLYYFPIQIIKSKHKSILFFFSRECLCFKGVSSFFFFLMHSSCSTCKLLKCTHITLYACVSERKKKKFKRNKIMTTIKGNMLSFIFTQSFTSLAVI